MITVFTPTYNRKSTLLRLFESLKKQSVKDFEWVIIDDGSTDGTDLLFDSLKELNCDFKIIYEKVERGGKHRAINRGVKIAKGEVFFIVDSDDFLSDDAIEKLEYWIETLDCSHKWAGVAGTKSLISGTIIGESCNSGEYFDAMNTERERYHLTGDKAEAYFTKVLLAFPFPEFDGEWFIAEDIVWNRIALEGYYLRWYGDTIYYCEYRDDGLTNNQEKNIQNPEGTLACAKLQIKAYPNSIRKRALAIETYYNATKDSMTVSEQSKKMEMPTFEIKILLGILNVYRRLKYGKR